MQHTLKALQYSFLYISCILSKIDGEILLNSTELFLSYRRVTEKQGQAVRAIINETSAKAGEASEECVELLKLFLLVLCNYIFSKRHRAYV